MLMSFWDYLRRAACDAVLAGIEDAVHLLEQDRSLHEFVHASDQLGRRLAKAAEQRIRVDQASKVKDEQPVGKAKHQRADQQSGEAPSPAKGETTPDPPRPVPSQFDSAAGHLKKLARQHQGSRGRGRPANEGGRQ